MLVERFSGKVKMHFYVETTYPPPNEEFSLKSLILQKIIIIKKKLRIIKVCGESKYV